VRRAEIIRRLAGTPASRPLRAIANAVLGGRTRVVRVRSGVARGMRMELNLTREKAYWLGHYEPELQETLRLHVRPGSVVYDVGAHIGFASLCAAKLGAHVFAFEPDPDNAARLRRNVELNAAAVEVVEAAAWDADGEVRLDAGGSARQRAIRAGSGVRSVTLSSFAAGRPAPDLVKIDVEGAEGPVLRGASALLAEAAPVVVCEIHGEEAERQVHAALGNYRLVELGSRWLVLALPQQGRF
jgi:FkbM family methyltransferase